jgi:hypothetical protein
MQFLALLRVLAVMFFIFLILPAQAQVVIDGNFDDWPAETQVDVPPNPPILTFQEGASTAPASWDANTNPSYFIDADISDFYYQEDEDYVYFRVDMNPLADVRRLFTETDMYLGNQRIELFVSVDPNPETDFQDTTGITWGWYLSGYDLRFRIFPFDTTFMDETGYETLMWEHTQEGNGWFYEQWRGDMTKGIKVAWNDEYNKAECAVPKSILFRPQNLPGYEPHDVIAVMVTSGATEKDNEWWQEQWSLPGRQGYLLDIDYLPVFEDDGLVKIDGNFDDWPAESQVDVPPNPPILTFQEGASTAPASWDANTNPMYFIDADISDFYYLEDENYVYFRVDMNPLADVRRLFTETDMYLGNQRIELFVSVDPNPETDFQDTTGITWGWWLNGYDLRFRIFPFDTTFMDETGYETLMWEHTQEGNQWAWEQWRGDMTKGIKVAWNDEYNKAECAVPKSILLNPQNLSGYEPSDVIAVMVASGATEKDNEWWEEQWALPGRQGYLLDLEYLPTSVREDLPVPRDFTLSQNYPNPFNPSTVIEFSLAQAQRVSLTVYNILGQEVARLIDRDLNAGRHAVNFEAGNLPSGIYFYTLQTTETVQTKKMVLMK